MSLCWRKLCTVRTAVSGDEERSWEHQHSCLHHPRGDDVQWLSLSQIIPSNACSGVFLAAVWPCYQASLAVLVALAHRAVLPLQPGPGEGRVSPRRAQLQQWLPLPPPLQWLLIFATPSSPFWAIAQNLSSWVGVLYPQYSVFNTAWCGFGG